MTCPVCESDRVGDVYYAHIVDGKARWRNGQHLPCPACIHRELNGDNT